MNEVITNTDHDPLGNALLDYHVNQQAKNIRVHSSLFESDIIPVAWFFRTYDDMPEIEKEVLKLCSGKILDWILDMGYGSRGKCPYLIFAGTRKTMCCIGNLQTGDPDNAGKRC